MSSLALSWLYSGPRQVGVFFLGAASSNVFSTHSREDMWSLAVVSVSICPHCRAQVTALEPGPEQSRDTAGDVFRSSTRSPRWFSQGCREAAGGAVQRKATFKEALHPS